MTAETPAQIAARLGLPLHPDATHAIIPRGESAYVLTEDARWLLKKHLHLAPQELLKVRRNEFSRGFRLGKGKPKERADRRPTESDEEIIRLHEVGFSDSEIATKLGRTHEAIRKARYRMGLAPNKRHERKAG